MILYLGIPWVLRLLRLVIDLVRENSAVYISMVPTTRMRRLSLRCTFCTIFNLVLCCRGANKFIMKN